MKLKQMLAHFQKIAQDFSITLPQYLVYLFKASGEVEALCMRFIPEFTGIEYASPIVKKMAKDILEEEEKFLIDDMRAKFFEIINLPLHLQKILDQVEDERVRIRMHPKQMQEIETIITFNARRVLFGILAGVISITTAILYIKIPSTTLLIIGFTVSSILGTGAITLPARIHLEWIKQQKCNQND